MAGQQEQEAGLSQRDRAVIICFRAYDILPVARSTS